LLTTAIVVPHRQAQPNVDVAGRPSCPRARPKAACVLLRRAGAQSLQLGERLACQDHARRLRRRSCACDDAGRVERFGVSLSTAHKHRKRAAVEQAPAESPAKEPPASTAVSASSRLHPRRDASVVAFWWKDDSAQCAVAVSDYGRLGGPGGRLRRISNTTATTMRTMRMRPLPLRAARRAISTRASCPFSNSERCDHTEVAPSAQRLPRALGRRVHRIPQMRKKAPPHPSRMRQGARRNFTLRHDCPNPATLS
jgi:hypothetical protein